MMRMYGCLKNRKRGAKEALIKYPFQAWPTFMFATKLSPSLLNLLPPFTSKKAAPSGAAFFLVLKRIFLRIAII